MGRDFWSSYEGGGSNPPSDRNYFSFVGIDDIFSTFSLNDLKEFVRREIRTLAHRSGLRPERSALDHSAILTLALLGDLCKYMGEI